MFILFKKRFLQWKDWCPEQAAKDFHSYTVVALTRHQSWATRREWSEAHEHLCSLEKVQNLILKFPEIRQKCAQWIPNCFERLRISNPTGILCISPPFPASLPLHIKICASDVRVMIFKCLFWQCVVVVCSSIAWRLEGDSLLGDKFKCERFGQELPGRNRYSLKQNSLRKKPGSQFGHLYGFWLR